MSPREQGAARPPRRRIDGVFLLDKPVGVTSNHALQVVRRLFSAQKAGHTGTLDPLASGLLPICLGEATKFSGELLDADKAYLATVQLGVITDSADAEGRVLERRPVAVTRHQVEAALAAFRGHIEQVPPMHSALKRDGKPLYEYARQGIELERAARSVVIHSIDPVEPWDELTEGRFQFLVRCSKGTYVRTLAADIGERLGCGAHLAGLRRTAIGTFGLGQAHTLDSLEAREVSSRDDWLLAPDFLLGSLPDARLPLDDARRLLHGQAVPWSGTPGDRLRVYDADGRFLGLCRQVSGDTLAPLRLVAEEPASPPPKKSPMT